MPRAKRNKEVTLSKVKPKGRDHKENQLQRLQAAAQANPFCYLFSVGNMRNNHLKEVREKWKGSSIFWGMNGVARKALGVDPENEIVEGISEITKVMYSLNTISYNLVFLFAICHLKSNCLSFFENSVFKDQ